MIEMKMAPFSHFFHTTEMQHIHQHVDSISAFYLHWSVKESALKYMGYGIDRVLDFVADPITIKYVYPRPSTSMNIKRC